MEKKEKKAAMAPLNKKTSVNDIWKDLKGVTIALSQNYVSSIGTVTQTMTQEMVTIKVACDTLKVSRKTIYRYIEKGLLTKI
jgi:predicted transcriptional regulator YheO